MAGVSGMAGRGGTNDAGSMAGIGGSASRGGMAGATLHTCVNVATYVLQITLWIFW